MSLKGKKRELDDSNDWGGYMQAKIRKLDKQFDFIKTQKNDNSSLNGLFKNVVIFVNGYTEPSSDELKQLMKRYGGGFQHYYSRSKCTHIIATNLPNSKIKELRGEKVVHPDWILDSIKAKKLLAYHKYLLYGAGKDYGEILSKFDKPLPHSVCSVAHENHASVTDTITSDSREKNEESESSVSGLYQVDSKQTTSNENSDVLRSSLKSDDKSLLEYAVESKEKCYQSSSGLVNDKKTAQRNLKKGSIPKAGDANFVTDYYTNSRLHYLSTWGVEFRDFINSLIQTTELKTRKKSLPKTSLEKRVIMHIDMDSFFVSVALRTRPELRGKPVAVCHSGRSNDPDNSHSSSTYSSTSEIASCSYEARAVGVKNGMWLGNARKLCPNLICVPYQFEDYRQVSQQFYEILASHTHEIQAVSCDEAFVDLTNYIESECLPVMKVVQNIREEIKKKTNCPASAGLASNILLARMSTKVAKPNGQFHLQDNDIAEFIGKQEVADLPGVGHALNKKLKYLNVITCTELQSITMSVLRREFGQKTGEMLYKYSRGQDDRQLKVERERKSVSAEINYAIRFLEESEPEKFIHDLSNEVQRRLKSAGLKGKQVTIKLRVRQKDAPVNPTKFMGCGRCDNISRSTNLNYFTDDESLIARECISMLKTLALSVSDIRGMGIQICKLSDDVRKQSTMPKTLHCFMNPRKESSSRNETRTGTNMTSDKNDNTLDSALESGFEQKESLNTPQQTPCEEIQCERETFEEFRLKLSDNEDECEQHELNKLPLLPGLPVFSPKRVSSSKRKSSLPQATSRSKCSANLSKRSPNKSPFKSLKKSPEKSGFQSFKESGVIGSLALPSPSQIDPAVFAALPEEIKKDIQTFYQQRNQKFEMNAAEEVPFKTQDAPEETRYLPNILTKNAKRDQNTAGRNIKKSKVKHKNIKRFASKTSNREESSCQFDASVLEALPECIRDELHLAYQQQRKHDEKAEKKNGKLTKNDAAIFVCTEPKDDTINTPILLTTKVKLAGAESLSDVKKMLKLWTNDAKDPLEEDLSVFVEYLRNLIAEKDLERTWLVLKFYRRLMITKKAWQASFNRGLDNIQNILKETYDGHLAINYFM
ncbi:DNA repair protein REV1-like [Dendronephthya gigantea]|uniref:DNA repair protein REV1-like n=1 Tax=Dendronephthya gigantea TaxID=151771 RepID=UPI00106ABD5E|nr:DNA repair protein REV1-like [Dendronephthya gigantea]